MTMATILVVDDEIDMLDTIAYNLERAGHAVLRADSAARALERLSPAPDLIISDVMMPGMNGLAFCAEVRRRQATALTPFLFVTARGQAGDKYEGLRAGADDYVTKPFDLPDLLARVNGRLQHRARATTLERDLEGAQRRWRQSAEPEELSAARKEQQRIAAEIHDAGYVDYQVPEDDPEAIRDKVAQLERRWPAIVELRATSLIGDAPAFLRQFEEILIAAASPEPTLIIGEPGTGKTAVADAIHRLGPRAGGPFRTINCAQLAAGDPTIAAGKLFGYGRNHGLPNLPREGQTGLLEEANGGVLFLDEIGELPRHAQSLLLFPLEGRPFQPAVGAGAPRTVSVKFVCATNRDLPAEVEAGRFPRDLYERLAGQVVRLPALRERPGDAAILAERLLRDSAPADPPLRLEAAALEAIASFPWPNNVRQLRNCISRAATRARLHDRVTIVRADLGDDVLRHLPRTTPSSLPAVAPAPAPAPAATAGGGPGRDDTEKLVGGGLTEREAREILTLRATGFQVGQAESRLGYSREAKTLSRRLRGISFKALGLFDLDVDRAAAFLAGDAALRPLVVRRLDNVVDSVVERLAEPDEALTDGMPAEYREPALSIIRALRRRRA
jgi:DNA-binding NtrC family response regulator